MLVYIHIPYCDSKCNYCSFNTYVDKYHTQKQYMKSLYKQLVFELKRFNTTEKSIETLFIGGGTPSTIDAKLYIPIFELLKPYLITDAEVTIEANPNSSTLEWLKEIYSLGVNRISFGVQSFNNNKLKNLNRAHNSHEAKQSILNANKIGFEHISLDIIYNYQNDTKEILENDINTAFSLPIDHISAYELTIEDGTKFASMENVKQENEDLAFFVTSSIEKNGFKAYEISNFGKYNSKHNLGYWQLKNYIGAGAGAVGFKDNCRYYPISNIESYIDNPLNIVEEPISSDELLTEKVFLGLRSSVGVSKGILTEKMITNANFLCEEKKLTLENNIYYNKNYFLSDELALYILE